MAGLAAFAALAIAALGMAGTAQATLTGEFAKFKYCPYKNEEVRKCVYSVTEGGEVKLGNKTVPIEKDVVLQGGFGKADKTTKISPFFGATEGKPTLQPVSQNVPGGLAGLVNCKTISDFILRVACEWTFENGLTGVGSTLELAGSPSNILISEAHLSRAEGLALRLPVKVKLENPLLGSECYVGSDASPVIWNLTAGRTEPPEGVEPLEGETGQINFINEGEIVELANNRLVENNWSAPGVTGCGGVFAFLLDPIVNASSGLPAAAGTNKAILENTIQTTTTFSVLSNDEENP